MCSSGCRFALSLSIGLLSVSLHSQTVVPDAGRPVPTFKAKVHVVVVDVVVINEKNQPMPGLHKEDFQVLEEGKPQTISSFEEHKGAPPASVKLPPMPPHVFTNYPMVKAPDSVNVLLLDWLNTQPQNQPFVRTQIKRYLKNVPAGTRIAIFTLGSQLHMVQGFTDDPSVLLAALEDKKGGASTETSPLLATASQAAEDRNTIDVMTMNRAAAAAIAAVREEMADTAATQTGERIQITFAALQQLARYLAGIAGRKNLIWFSDSFPIAVFPEAGVPREYQGQIQKTADLLTPDQVAIYPVSADGLAVDATWEAQYAGGGPSVREENERRAPKQEAMEELARDTGGKAFYNTNGLSDAVGQIVDDGTHYYTLAYTPTDRKTDGSYRNIRVHLRTGQYKLHYRRGYYAENTKVKTALAAQLAPGDPLMPLMGNGLPDFSQILYKIRVLPANPQPALDAPRVGGNAATLKPPVTRYNVDFAILPDDLRLDAAPDGSRQGELEIMTVAYDHDGKPLNLVVRKPRVSLAPKIYAAVQQVGLQVHQEIDVPAGDFYLRTGIYDAGSGKAGTIGIPVSAATASPK